MLENTDELQAESWTKPIWWANTLQAWKCVEKPQQKYK